MRWEDERYVRVYTRDSADWLAMGWEAQALLVLALRKADRAGLVHTGKSGLRGLAALVGMPLEVVARAVEVLLADGCMRQVDCAYLFPNFIEAQESKQTDAQRKRESRARSRDAALAFGHKDAALVTEGLDRVTPPVTRPPDLVTDVPDNVTPCLAVPSRAVPSFSASQEPAAAVPMADDIPQAAEEDVHEADERPALVLVEQKSEKPTRKPSAAEALFERLERRRRILCEDEKLAFIPARWPAARINRDLGPVARAEKAGGEDWERFRGAWGEFIEDPEAAHLDVPYSLDWFWKCRSRYEGKALKAGGVT